MGGAAEAAGPPGCRIGRPFDPNRGTNAAEPAMASDPPRPRLPIGISDFRKLRESAFAYVDKTDFVTQILTAGAAVVLVPRPRRFGKTLNLSTIRYFVEKSSEDRSALFEGLAVWGSTEARRHFRRYPVVSMTFKDIKAGSVDEAFAAIRREIRRVHHEHAYLLDDVALRPEQARSFRQILDLEGQMDLYAASLRDLSMLLARHHGEPVVILIDEYDTPIHSAATRQDEHKLSSFLQVLLSSGLKDNPHLFKGVLTGILRLTEKSVFSGLNNFVTHSLIRPECATCFGFTPDEVKDLAERMGCAEHLPELESWYNGYRFAGHVIYNPWSVLNFLDSPDKVLRPYWVNTSADDLLRRVVFAHGLGRSGEMETLLQGGEIEKPIDDRIALRDLDRSPDAVWSFLLFTGYLKAVKLREDEFGATATLAVPNREVMTAYRTMFQTWLEQRLGGENEVDELLRAILSGDAEACEELLGRLLQSLSVHDLAGRRISSTKAEPPAKGASTRTAKPATPGTGFDPEAEVILTPEKVYHVFVVSLLLGLQPRFAVRPNRESGFGRYDVMVIPRTPGQPGVVLELKVRNALKRETAKAAMTAALRQIRERDYAAELRACGADPIHEMGIVFDGKQAHVQVAAPPAKRAPARKRTTAPAPASSRPARRRPGRR